MSRIDRALTAQSKSARYHWLAVRSSGRLAVDLQAQVKHWAHVARSQRAMAIWPMARTPERAAMIADAKERVWL